MRAVYAASDDGALPAAVSHGAKLRAAPVDIRPDWVRADSHFSKNKQNQRQGWPMSELALIEETAAGLLGAPAHDAAWDPESWSRLEESGLTLIGIPEERGGTGGTLEEAAIVARAAARAAAMLPLAETALLGGWLLAEAGYIVPEGPLTACVLESGSLVEAGEGYELSGRARSVPWARFSSCIAVLVDGAVVRLDPSQTAVTPGMNLAGEPRDDLLLERVRVDDADVRRVSLGVDALQRRGALVRSIGIAGAAEATAGLAFDLVRGREQFGRPLSAFQAVQQMVAGLAAEVAATTAAVEAAVEAESLLCVAAAKIQAGWGASLVARLAHQLHGAIGITHESQLHLFTRRLWAWRDEYGSETFWAGELGREVAVSGADRLWEQLADEDPPS
jgi:acyl-CoA dehydrogenase